jgi:hypothetical protein
VLVAVHVGQATELRTQLAPHRREPVGQVATQFGPVTGSL